MEYFTKSNVRIREFLTILIAFELCVYFRHFFIQAFGELLSDFRAKVYIYYQRNWTLLSEGLCRQIFDLNSRNMSYVLESEKAKDIDFNYIEIKLLDIFPFSSYIIFFF